MRNRYISRVLVHAHKQALLEIIYGCQRAQGNFTFVTSSTLNEGLTKPFIGACYNVVATQSLLRVKSMLDHTWYIHIGVHIIHKVSPLFFIYAIYPCVYKLKQHCFAHLFETVRLSQARPASFSATRLIRLVNS